MYAHTQHEEERRRAEEKRTAAEARRKEELERREREVSAEGERGRGLVSPLLLPLSSLWACYTYTYTWLLLNYMSYNVHCSIVHVHTHAHVHATMHSLSHSPCPYIHTIPGTRGFYQRTSCTEACQSHWWTEVSTWLHVALGVMPYYVNNKSWVEGLTTRLRDQCTPYLVFVPAVTHFFLSAVFPQAKWAWGWEESERRSWGRPCKLHISPFPSCLESKLGWIKDTNGSKVATFSGFHLYLSLLQTRLGEISLPLSVVTLSVVHV